MKKIICAMLSVVFILSLCAQVLADGTDTIITLADGASTVTGDGAEVNKDVITITKPGKYKASGNLSDGQIVVNVSKEEVVHLDLAGVNITCSYSAPIYVISADKTEIKLVNDSENVLSDTLRDDPEDSELPDACLFSKDDLTIKGTGKLTVYGNNYNGIGTKDDLKINGGIITVTAVNNAIRGSDSVTIRGGRIVINGCDDGIKSTKKGRDDKGFVHIQGATVYITSSGDAIQAERNVTIKDANVYTYAQDRAVDCKGTVDIAEGCLVEN